ncbi:MAG: protein kinase [Verrucomicrobia bacterium]|nr:protein kinase [Verrucomicrobiota bacterium]MDA1087294.1 protein kinase [Verrucomicrobiota bacterium]
MSDQPRTQIGDFEIIDEIGGGAEGKIFRGRCVSDDHSDVDQGQEVALKVLRYSGEDPDAAERFDRRMKFIRSLVHPNIVRCLDSFVWRRGELFEERQVLVMELLNGDTLDKYLERNPNGLSWEDVKSIYSECLQALIYSAEEVGIVHLDIKPSNIFYTKDGVAKLIDFGIARKLEGTQTTTVGWRGSFDYMAPDFVKEGDFTGDIQSDVFSLGVTIYQTLLGKLPFDPLGENANLGYVDRWRHHSGITPSFRAGIFQVLDGGSAFLEKAMQPEKSDRFLTFTEMLHAFEQLGFRTLTGESSAYELRGLLGRGGQAAVYQARRLSDGEDVAIKRVSARNQSDRFRREARILGENPHDHIVNYIDFLEIKGWGGDEYCLILELLEGMPGATLRNRIRNSAGGLPVEEVIVAFRHFVSALYHLHNNHCIHRDIKPGNLYLPPGKPDRAKIFDLGIVRDESGSVTTGLLPGTLDYMAPEFALQPEFRGDARSDIYAMGMALYESLTGGYTYGERLPRKASEGHVAFRERALSDMVIDTSHRVFREYPGLRRVVTKATAKDPTSRYVHAGEMEQDMVAVLQEGPVAVVDVDDDAEAPTVAMAMPPIDAGEEEATRAVAPAAKAPIPADRLPTMRRPAPASDRADKAPPRPAPEQSIKRPSEKKKKAAAKPKPAAAKRKAPLMAIAAVVVIALIAAAAVPFAMKSVRRGAYERHVQKLVLRLPSEPSAKALSIIEEVADEMPLLQSGDWPGVSELAQEISAERVRRELAATMEKYLQNQVASGVKLYQAGSRNQALEVQSTLLQIPQRSALLADLSGDALQKALANLETEFAAWDAKIEEENQAAQEAARTQTAATLQKLQGRLDRIEEAGDLAALSDSIQLLSAIGPEIRTGAEFKDLWAKIEHAARTRIGAIVEAMASDAATEDEANQQFEALDATVTAIKQEHIVAMLGDASLAKALQGIETKRTAISQSIQNLLQQEVGDAIVKTKAILPKARSTKPDELKAAMAEFAALKFRPVVERATGDARKEVLAAWRISVKQLIEQVDPLNTRDARLTSVGQLLSIKQSPELLGNDVHAALVAELEAQQAIFYIDLANESGEDVEIRLGNVKVDDLGAGRSIRMQRDIAEGGETIMLQFVGPAGYMPHTESIVLAPGGAGSMTVPKLTAKPRGLVVRVSGVPQGDDPVTVGYRRENEQRARTLGDAKAGADGKFEYALTLDPNRYVLLFTRPDFLDISHKIEVKVGEGRVTAEGPSLEEWKPTEALALLTTARAALDGKDLDKASAVLTGLKADQYASAKHQAMLKEGRERLIGSWESVAFKGFGDAVAQFKAESYKDALDAFQTAEKHLGQIPEVYRRADHQARVSACRHNRALCGYLLAGGNSQKMAAAEVLSREGLDANIKKRAGGLVELLRDRSSMAKLEASMLESEIKKRGPVALTPAP